MLASDAVDRPANTYARPDSVDTRSRFHIMGERTAPMNMYARTGRASRFDLITNKGTQSAKIADRSVSGVNSLPVDNR